MKHKNGFVSLKEYKQAKLRKSEKKVFKAGFTPLRFKRNQNSISQKEQFVLFKSRVAIVGCGGLGGSVSEILARIGAGNITLIDKDRFCEHNLNRQNFSSFKNLHEKKVNVLKKELLRINPTMNIKKHFVKLHVKNINKLLSHVDVVIDCVDNIKTKKLLALWCYKNNKKFIHGAIGGKTMQVSTNKNLSIIYKDDRSGAEKECGNLVFTALACASFQASLCIKMLLEKDFCYEDMLYCDLDGFEFVNLPFQ